MAGKFEAPRGGRKPEPKSAPKSAPKAAPKSTPKSAAQPSSGAPRQMPPLRPDEPQRPIRRTPPAQPPRRKQRRPFPVLPIVLIILLAILIFIGVKVVGAIVRENNRPTTPAATQILELPEGLSTQPPTTEPSPPETTLPEPEHVVSTASIGTIGDLLMHKSVLDGARSTDGSYDFSYIFRFLAPYAAEKDYAIANLETTFGGTGFPYQGNPSFNCPDVLAQNARDAGFDMFLTANNHCYDTLMTGITRSLEISRGAGLKTLGTRLNEDELRYEIVEINGIKVGMVCYTYTMSVAGSGKPSLNGNTPVEKPALVNWFYNAKLDAFYAEAADVLEQMKAEGAEATMFFIHWGEEYKIAENSTQDAIAQKLCDLGVDVIVGGHPHVIEPVTLLTSREDDSHKTVCIYSLGNAVSNQRIVEMRLKTGHTEDGCMFSVTFEKYSDGTVYLAGADVLPTWVNMRVEAGRKLYDILPLDDSTRDGWQEAYGLTDATLTSAKDSYNRTMDLVGGGLKICNDYLAKQKEARESYYYDLAMNPAA